MQIVTNVSSFYVTITLCNFFNTSVNYVLERQSVLSKAGGKIKYTGLTQDQLRLGILSSE